MRRMKVKITLEDTDWTRLEARKYSSIVNTTFLVALNLSNCSLRVISHNSQQSTGLSIFVEQLKTVYWNSQNAFAYPSLFFGSFSRSDREWRQQLLQILRQTVRQDNGL